MKHLLKCKTCGCTKVLMCDQPKMDLFQQDMDRGVSAYAMIIVKRGRLTFE